MNELIEQYRQGLITRSELEHALKNNWDNLELTDEDLRQYHRPEMLEQILLKGKREKEVVKLQWWKYVAAAVTLTAIVLSVKLLLSRKSETPPVVTNEVNAPTSNRAMIVLGDGRKIYLDSAANGQLLNIDELEVVKDADGSVVYKGSTEEVQYNTFVNPRNSKVGQIALSDGTRVWLNSGSAIRFPTAFAGNRREVVLDGEGYFDVAKDKTKPFVVTAKGTQIEVLGTEFNLNAYDDEKDLKVTLLKGAVVVLHQTQKQSIVPGDQAVVADAIRVQKDVDLDAVVAWRSGFFSFNKQSLDEIMKQLARWYDIEVVMEVETNPVFTIMNAGKDVPLSSLLKSMETSGGVHFEIKGKKVFVKP